MDIADYKPIVIGGLPADWSVVPLGTLANISSGGTPNRKAPRFWGGNIPWITTSEIEFNLITKATQYITEDGLRHSAARIYPHGTLLMALYGQGKTRGKIAMLGIDAATNQACAGIAPYVPVCRKFLFHFLASRYREIRSLSHTGNQENLNATIVRSIPIVLPPEAEQARITETLDDVDSVLQVLGELISKKRNLRHAAMQQLLSGHTRLPGFADEWKTYSFEQLFKFLKTGNNARSDLSPFGDVGYLHYGDIHTHQSPFLDGSVAQVPTIDTSKVSSLPTLQEGDLVMVDASEDYEGIGKSVEVINITRPMVGGLHTFLLRGDPQLLAAGFKAYLQYIPSVRAALVRLATGISVYGISKANVKSIVVSVPGIHEQSAIAGVISDMDAEIAALEERRKKVSVLKQGMMQDLFTARRRLV